MPEPRTDAASTQRPAERDFFATPGSIAVRPRARMPESARRIPIAFGTDVVFVMPGETRGTLSIEFISSFLEAGATPKQILAALTVDAARLMGMEKERGRIAPGFAADIVATPENPLQNIQTVRHVAFVMKAGKVYRNDSP